VTHKYPHPQTGKRVIPSVTQLIGDATDKSGPLTQWAANQVVEWIRENCTAAVDYPQNAGRDWYKVWDKDLDAARFHFRDVSKEALDVGSIVHSAIEEYLKIELLDAGRFSKDEYIKSFSQTDNPQVVNAFAAFLQWAEEHDLKPIATEQTVYGQTDGYTWAGTLDLLCVLDGKKYVIDFKTSRAIYASEYGPQIAAYRSCLEGVEGCGVLRLDKNTGEPEWKDFCKRYEQDLRVFRAMAKLYFLRHPRIAKGCSL